MRYKKDRLVMVFAVIFALLTGGKLLAQEPLAFASGSWFDPQRDGEGFVVQVLPDQRALVTWFTYPPQEEEGSQAWMIGTGTVTGNRIVITEMLRPVGATFGQDFDPASVVRENWGSLELTFTNCNEAVATWTGPAEFGSGNVNLVRLSFIDDVECDGRETSEPDRIIAGRSGAWFDPSHNGEGWMLETLPDGRAVVYWFTYDDQGRQAWLLGVAEIEGRSLWIKDMMISRGARFGDAFRSEDVILESWGEFGFLFDSCTDASMRYASSDARFGEGTLEPVHLAQLVATSCKEPLAAEPLTAGSWQRAADMPVPMTETASASAAGSVYTGGGLGTLQRFQRFDPVSGSYQEMPSLPAQRHHPMMASDGRRIYLAGGYRNRLSLENAGSNFWRYDPEAGSWEILPDMPQARAAGAALFLQGRIWVVGGLGVGNKIQSFDIVTGQWELYPGDARMIADHMQAVAFENEIWVIGGRSDFTSQQVLIWNPVTRAWREGPPLNHRRSGLAAKVVQGQIMVVGGEAIDTMPGQIIPSLEVFAPGAEKWEFGSSPPVAVHGTTGAVLNGLFILPGGSDKAGDTSLNRSTQVYTPAMSAAAR